MEEIIMIETKKNLIKMMGEQVSNGATPHTEKSISKMSSSTTTLGNDVCVGDTLFFCYVHIIRDIYNNEEKASIKVVSFVEREVDEIAKYVGYNTLCSIDGAELKNDFKENN